jgi:hypothetical protein
LPPTQPGTAQLNPSATSVSLDFPLYADHWSFARYLAKNSPELITSEFNNPRSHLDALLLSIKFSGADLNLH